MIEFQLNFTSLVQSQRLLELGVPAESADFYYQTKDSVIPLVRNSNGLPLFPCWTIGRLIDILCKCYREDMRFIWYWRGGMIESLINVYEIFSSEIDFSKLEEGI